MFHQGFVCTPTFGEYRETSVDLDRADRRADGMVLVGVQTRSGPMFGHVAKSRSIPGGEDVHCTVGHVHGRRDNVDDSSVR